MIGVFDSGLGGLTVLRALSERFPKTGFTYLGDHANVPYGNRDSDEVVQLTQSGVENLFQHGCHLVILGCNTATAVAARQLQQNWLPTSRWASAYNVLGIVAPTVEAATQTPWAVTTPQYPQKTIQTRSLCLAQHAPFSLTSILKRSESAARKSVSRSNYAPSSPAPLKRDAMRPPWMVWFKRPLPLCSTHLAARRPIKLFSAAHISPWSSICSASICPRHAHPFTTQNCCRQP